jgi:sugar phosphate isomerase/epimerase
MRDFGKQQMTKQSVMAAVARFELADWQRSAELLNGLGQKARTHGLQVLYHNGNFEFVAAGVGRTGYDVLLEATDPALVKLEIDCGWVASAGYDPLKYLASQSGRVPLIHINDMKPTAPNVAMQIESTEIGSGIVDWPALLHAAQAAGVEYAFAEQEEPFVHPPLDSARMNLQYLSRLKL